MGKVKLFSLDKLWVIEWKINHLEKALLHAHYRAIENQLLENFFEAFYLSTRKVSSQIRDEKLKYDSSGWM